MADSMVERVARALQEADETAWAETGLTTGDELRRLARFAIRAMHEPTEAQIDAAVLTFVRENGGIEHAPALTWRAMIDAALAE